MTYDGHVKPVEGIREGDLLMGPDSAPRRVQSLIAGHGDLFRITPVKGAPWIVNSDHILTLVRTCDGSSDGGTIVDVPLREWMEWSKTKKHIHKLLRTPVIFREDTSPSIDPYLVGIVLGDGSLDGTVSVTTADDEIVCYLQNVAYEYDLKISSRPAGGKSTTYYLVGKRGEFCGRAPDQKRNPLYDFFRKVGLARCNSGSKFIPHEFKIASRSHRLRLLAGLLDTDGCLTGNNGYDYISKSQRLSDGVAFISRSLGFAAYTSQCDKTDQKGHGGSYWRVSISGNCEIIPCLIPRKRARKRLQKKDVCRTGFSVTPVGCGDYYGFTLDGDGRYLLDDFTVTHNSGKTQMMIALAEWGRKSGGKVVIFTNRILLTRQTRRVFHGEGVLAGVVSSSMPHYEYDDADVQIATIQTVLSRRKNDYWLPGDLVLVDEAHQVATGESAALLNEYRKRGSYLVSVTATPLGVSSISDKLVVAAGTRDLQEEGKLCFARWFAPSELDTRKLVKGKVDLSLTENEARRTWGPLKGDDRIRTRIVGNILEHYQRLHPRQIHTLAFAPGVKESVWAARYCRTRGIRALHIDGKDFWCDGKLYDRNRDDQQFQDFMQEWRDGEIPILWNRYCLREGIDEPQIECLMLATPVGSYRSFLQMVGRGLRISPETPQSIIVLDFGGGWWRHGSVNVNVDWESVFDCSDPDVLSKNRIAKLRETGESVGRACPQCGMVHSGKGRFLVCQYCGHELFRGKPSRPIIQADGTLTEVNGEPVKQWKIKEMASNEKTWNSLYWNAVKNKGGEVSFNQLYAQFGYKTAVEQGSKTQPAFWKMYYPPRNLPNMPERPNDWHRLVSEVDKTRLI